MRPLAQKGFNLIELAVIVAVIGMLLAVGVPMMSEIIANGRARTAAEGLVNGMQLARAEALRQNGLVDLQIQNDGVSWNVVVRNTGAMVQTRTADAGSNTVCVLVGGTGGPTAGNAPCPAATTYTGSTITFNGWGSMVSTTPSAFRFTPRGYSPTHNPTTTGRRPMCAVVATNTPRLCDPARSSATDPQACFTSAGPIAGCCGIDVGGC